MGRLEKIWIKSAKQGPMDGKDRATLVEGRGLVGNANQGGKRQITIIEEEVWTRIGASLDVSVDPSARRANLMVKDLSLAESRGRVLVVGSCRLLVCGETRPCERMDEACPGLRRALEESWAGGAYAEVIDGGEVLVGNEVSWEN